MDGSFLSVEQAATLLPEEYKELAKLERSLFQSASGHLVAFANSKLYDDNTFWFSCTVKYFMERGVDKFCFIAGMLGVLFITSDRLGEYIKHCGWKKQKKGLSYYMRLKYRENRYILYCSEYPDIDITDCFIPYNGE